MAALGRMRKRPFGHGDALPMSGQLHAGAREHSAHAPLLRAYRPAARAVAFGSPEVRYGSHSAMLRSRCAGTSISCTWSIRSSRRRRKAAACNGACTVPAARALPTMTPCYTGFIECFSTSNRVTLLMSCSTICRARATRNGSPPSPSSGTSQLSDVRDSEAAGSKPAARVTRSRRAPAKRRIGSFRGTRRDLAGP